MKPPLSSQRAPSASINATRSVYKMRGPPSRGEIEFHRQLDSYSSLVTSRPLIALCKQAQYLSVRQHSRKWKRGGDSCCGVGLATALTVDSANRKSVPKHVQYWPRHFGKSCLNNRRILNVTKNVLAPYISYVAITDRPNVTTDCIDVRHQNQARRSLGWPVELNYIDVNIASTFFFTAANGQNVCGIKNYFSFTVKKV